MVVTGFLHSGTRMNNAECISTKVFKLLLCAYYYYYFFIYLNSLLLVLLLKMYGEPISITITITRYIKKAYHYYSPDYYYYFPK